MTTPEPDPTEVLNPVDAERAIREVAVEIARNVRVASAADRQARHMKVLYDRAYAHAYLAAEGPAPERKCHAELETIQERDQMEVALLAYRHATRHTKSLESKLRAFQSAGASVRAIYGTSQGFGR